MAIKTATYTLPAKWASALVSGDHSGLSNQEEREYWQWMHENNTYPGDCMECGEQSYIGHFNGLQTEVLDYVFFVPKSA